MALGCQASWGGHSSSSPVDTPCSHPRTGSAHPAPSQGPHPISPPSLSPTLPVEPPICHRPPTPHLAQSPQSHGCPKPPNPTSGAPQLPHTNRHPWPHTNRGLFSPRALPTPSAPHNPHAPTPSCPTLNLGSSSCFTATLSPSCPTLNSWHAAAPHLPR